MNPMKWEKILLDEPAVVGDCYWYIQEENANKMDPNHDSFWCFYTIKDDWVALGMSSNEIFEKHQQRIVFWRMVPRKLEMNPIFSRPLPLP